MFIIITAGACTHSEIEPENINISISKGKLSINDTYIKYPFSLEEMSMILGPYDKSKSYSAADDEPNNLSVTWNKHGIYALLIGNNNNIDSLVVSVGREDNKNNLEPYLLTCGTHDGSGPTQVFKGQISVNGYKLNSDTNAEILVATLSKYSLAANSNILNRKGRYTIISKGDDVNEYWLPTMVCINKSDNKLKIIRID